MAIFSLFGKKEELEEKPPRGRSLPSKRDSSQPGAGTAGGSSAQRSSQQGARRATAMKIDAIESEMSSEFILAKAANTVPGVAASTRPNAPARPASTPQAAMIAPGTLPVIGATTAFLLNGATALGDIATPASDATAILEEAAILFSNGQTEVVEQMLIGAIQEDNLGGATLTGWWMLFDLYQISGKQQEFETLSIEYVKKFETSPPAWTGNNASAKKASPAGAVPSVAFSGKLDASAGKMLERLQKYSESHRTLRLEFNRVGEVHPEGCTLLLDMLKKLHKSGHDLILVGAADMVTKIRAIVEVGRRDETEAPWLLLLEVLRLLNREQEFEEASIDYCITYEVSPPAFVPPKNKVTTAAAESSAADDSENDDFKMPVVVEGAIDQLLIAIGAYTDQHNPSVIDCSRLTRVDFTAAGKMLTGLAPFCGNGKVIEFRNVNHLVAALFSVIGIKDLVRVHPRKT